MKILIKDYVHQNKIILIGYILVTTIFYMLNYIFFSNSIDLPPDILFIIGYIIISPGVIVIITMYRSKVLLVDSSKSYYYNIVIHSLVVLFINFVALAIYEVFRTNQGYWENNMWIIIAISTPIIFIGMIIAFEYKLRFKNLRNKLIVLFTAMLSWYLLDMFLNESSTRYLMHSINFIYFIIIPVYLLLFWYRKRIVN
ncbi:MAG: hypothetical protein QM489_07210 [Candidatus Izemoplasma sp.]